MREKFREVLELQLRHSSENTPEMARRGNLIRNEIPEELRAWAALRQDAVLPFRGRMAVQGKDGTGLKTFVPWVRIHSPDLSPSAQLGWYVVFLFRADGAGVALCLSHGSTRWDGADFKPRSPAEAAMLMTWGRGIVGDQAARLGMVPGVDLGFAERLSRAYETTTAFSKTYSLNDLPSDETIERDTTAAVGLLGELYRALELGRAPSSTPPEVLAASDALAEVSRPNAPKPSVGQGRGLNAAERAVVEAHAMTVAYQWLVDNGYDKIRDVHRTHSCDYLATRNGQEVHIEVKGTTSAFGSILLTANEVELHQAKHPNNALVVVHNIELQSMRSKATGGTVRAYQGWQINECVLRPLSYQCFLTEAGS